MPGEGRDLSSRQTQQVRRDLEIGQPINSEQCSEIADGVTRKSEGRSRVSLLRQAVKPARSSEVPDKGSFPGQLATASRIFFECLFQSTLWNSIEDIHEGACVCSLRCLSGKLELVLLLH